MSQLPDELTQQSQTQTQTQSQSQAPQKDYPYIKKVSLQNFMCHENFSITLDPHMNIIVGTNGSGKSSILTAIMIALGGRAKTTSRADNIAGFVQRGKSRASIHVTIHVPAIGSSKIHAKYGESLTVIRSFGEGYSRYEVRDHNMKPVKNAGANEVHSICHQFGFFPDNELAMLSQENAKEFLIHASEKTKYQKLRRALLQHIIERDRNAVQKAQLRQAELLDHMGLRRQNIDFMESRADEVLSRLERQTSTAAEIKQIERILQWREVPHFKERVHEITKKLEEAEKLRDEIGSEEALHTEMLACEDKIKSYYNSKDEELKKLSNATEKEKEWDLNFVKDSSNLPALEEDIKARKDSIKQKKEDLQALKDSIKNVDPDSVNQRIEELNKDLEGVESERKTTRQMIENIERDVLKKKEHDSVMKRKVDNAEKSIREKAVEKSSVDKQIEKVRKNESLELGDTSHNMKKLIDAVKLKNWNSPPKGPLYRYLTLNDEGERYSPALERLWNTTLDSWWVTNETDRRELLSLAKAHKIYTLRVINRKDDPFDFSKELPDASDNYWRIFDVVKFENDNIARIFIDMNKVERLVLSDSTEKGLENVEIQNVSDCIVAETSSDNSTKFMMISYKNNRLETSKIFKSSARRIKISNESLLAQLKEQSMTIKEDLKKARNELTARMKNRDDAKSELETAEKHLSRAQHKLRKLTGQSQSLYSEITKLRNITFDSNSIAEIKELEMSIENERQDLEGIKAVYHDNKEEAEATRDTLEKHKELTRQIKRIIGELNFKIDGYVRRKEELKSKIDQRAYQINGRQRRVDAYLSQLSEAREEYEDKRKYTQEIVGPEPVKGESESLDLLLFEDSTELVRKKRRLEEESRLSPSNEEELEKARIEKEQAVTSRLEIERIAREMKELAETIKTRTELRAENEKRAWQSIKRKIQRNFRKTLSKRGFLGNVDINDEEGKLVASSTPDSNTGRDMSTLSGGEKSYTQIALLMSVWKSMQVGFVAMDEYDVFMDKTNRGMSLGLLDVTVSSSSIQCVLITPQNVSTDALSGEYKVHKMAPARAER